MQLAPPQGVVGIAQGDNHKGTGFVVDERHIITCAHVVYGADVEIIVPSGSAGWRRTAVEKSIYDWAPSEFGNSTEDYALLVAREPLDQPCLPLLGKLSPWTLDKLAGQLMVHGFRGEDGVYGVNPTLTATGATWIQDGLLRTAQLHGGVPDGASGAPVLIQVDAEIVVVGMMAHGGEKQPRSVFYGAELLAAFARRHGARPRTFHISWDHHEKRRWKKVLISYATTDEEKATELNNQLKAAGFNASLLSPRALGAARTSERDEVIGGSHTLVALSSRSSRRSATVAEEVRLAQRLGIHTVAVRLDKAARHHALRGLPTYTLAATPKTPRPLEDLCNELDSNNSRAQTTSSAMLAAGTPFSDQAGSAQGGESADKARLTPGIRPIAKWLKERRLTRILLAAVSIISVVIESLVLWTQWPSASGGSSDAEPSASTQPPPSRSSESPPADLPAQEALHPPSAAAAAPAAGSPPPHPAAAPSISINATSNGGPAVANNTGTVQINTAPQHQAPVAGQSAPKLGAPSNGRPH